MSKNSLNQAYQTLLDNFKRANKVRKEKLAKEAGHPTADAYKSFLEKKAGVTPKVATPKKTASPKKVTKTPTPVPNEIPTIHNVYVLDASSSMEGNKFDNALKGINTEIEQLKQDKSINYTQTVVRFSYPNEIRFVELMRPIQAVGRINDKAYGNTALNDAIGQTITKLRNSVKVGEKVLIKIFTDGEENASREYNHQTIKQLIAEVEPLGFTITFVGTDRDVKEVVRNLNIRATNTLVHNNTAKGVQDAFLSSANATRGYAQKVLAKEDVLEGFYKQKSSSF